MKSNAFKNTVKEERYFHFHETGQFLFLREGLLALKTKKRSWVMPKEYLAWIPRNTAHAVQSSGVISGWGLMAPKNFDASLPKEVCILRGSLLLVALLERLASGGSKSSKAKRAIQDLIFEEIQKTEQEAFGISMPTAENILKVANGVLKNPQQDLSLDEWAGKASMSKRNFTRKFRLETGVSFSKWRRAALNHRALELIASGKSVSETSLELGYESVSAFIAMFRKEYGRSPMHFLGKRKGLSEDVRN